MNQGWWVRRGSEEFGPYAWWELLGFAREGRLLPLDELREDGTQWVQAASIQELQTFLNIHSSGVAWWLNRSGARFGPYAWEDLLGFSREGRLGVEDLLWKEGTPEWIPVSQLEALLVAMPTSVPRRSGKRGRPYRWLVPLAAGLCLILGGVILMVARSKSPAKWRWPFSQEQGLAAQASAPLDDLASQEMIPGGGIDVTLLDRLSQSAQQGDIQAMVLLSDFHRLGRAVEGNPSEGIALLRQAAAAGDAEALAQLADAYDSGLLVPHDPKKALALRQEAARKGSQLARWSLGEDEP